MGLFDGAISQASDLFDAKVTPAFNLLHADLSGMKGSSDALDHSVDALTAQLTAMQAQQGALIAALKMNNKLHAAELHKPA
jgi:hypothetical protein